MQKLKVIIIIITIDLNFKSTFDTRCPLQNRWCTRFSNKKKNQSNSSIQDRSKELFLINVEKSWTPIGPFFFQDAISQVPQQSIVTIQRCPFSLDFESFSFGPFLEWKIESKIEWRCDWTIDCLIAHSKSIVCLFLFRVFGIFGTSFNPIRVWESTNFDYAIWKEIKNTCTNTRQIDRVLEREFVKAKKIISK